MSGLFFLCYPLEIKTTAMIFIAILLYIAFIVFVVAAQWITYQKANQPGWACLVPIYNIIVLCEIAQKPTWWVAMMFIPFANLVFLIMLMNGVSKSFGKDEGFTVGLVLLSPIFWAILAWGDAQYQYGTVPPPQGSEDILDM